MLQRWRHTGSLASLDSSSPLARQVQPMGHRQAGSLIGHRDAHRHLPVALLVQHAAVLPRPHRALALPRKARVLDDPEAASQEVLLPRHPLADPPPYLAFELLGLRQKVMRRMMPSAPVHAIDKGRHRPYCLTRQRQHQPGAADPQPGMPVRMSQPCGQTLHLPLKPPA